MEVPVPIIMLPRVAIVVSIVMVAFLVFPRVVFLVVVTMLEAGIIICMFIGLVTWTLVASLVG